MPITITVIVLVLDQMLFSAYGNCHVRVFAIIISVTINSYDYHYYHYNCCIVTTVVTIIIHFMATAIAAIITAAIATTGDL